MHHASAPRRRDACWAGTAATAVAVAAHMAGGGDLPGWGGLLAPWIAAVWVFLLLGTRTLTWPRIAVGTAASQVSFHYLFVFGSLAAGAGSAGRTGTGHDHGGTASTTPAVGDLGSGTIHGDLRMWSWHAVGALVTTALAAWGSRLARTMRRVLHTTVRRWVRRLLRMPDARPLGDHGAQQSAPVLVQPRRQPSGRFLISASRRGPPHLDLAA